MFIGFNAAGKNPCITPKKPSRLLALALRKMIWPSFFACSIHPYWPYMALYFPSTESDNDLAFFLGHLAAREKWCWFKPPLPLSKPALFEGDVADAKWGGFKVTAACHRDQKWIKSRMNMDEHGRPAEHMCKNPSECGDFECKACDYNLSPASDQPISDNWPTVRWPVTCYMHTPLVVIYRPDIISLNSGCHWPQKIHRRSRTHVPFVT